VTEADSPATPPAAQADAKTQGSNASSLARQGQPRRLSTVATGEKVRLVRVDAGRGLNCRLAAMGFVPSAAITVVSNGHPGPFVVIVKDVKMMLGRGVAHKILVK
jgi:ferrous iron transport protein A